MLSPRKENLHIYTLFKKTELSSLLRVYFKVYFRQLENMQVLNYHYKFTCCWSIKKSSCEFKVCYCYT